MWHRVYIKWSPSSLAHAAPLADNQWLLLIKGAFDVCGLRRWLPLYTFDYYHRFHIPLSMLLLTGSIRTCTCTIPHNYATLKNYLVFYYSLLTQYVLKISWDLLAPMYHTKSANLIHGVSTKVPLATDQYTYTVSA